MYTSTLFLTLLATASTAQAFVLSDITSNGKRTLAKMADTLHDAASSLMPRTCPAVWSEISTTLTAQFLANGQCTDAARAAIRAAFHDW